MPIFETKRLLLCRLDPKDAAFIFELMNDPSWKRYIGDRGIKTLEDAEAYIRNGPVKSYHQFNFGLYAARLKDTNLPIGLCGLLKRDNLDDADIGFAFLPQYAGKGYAFESAGAIIDHAASVLGMRRILAIASPDNSRSVTLLEKLGFSFKEMIRMPDHAADSGLFQLSVNAKMVNKKQ